MKPIANMVRRLRDDRSGLALIELAYSAPILVTMIMGGAELTNFTTTKMRISQVALHVADNAARMGTGTVLTKTTVSETQINDVFIGARLQSGKLEVLKHGRIILSNVEPMPAPNAGNKYRITWQRCKGAKVHASTYGKAGDTNLEGVGPAGRQVTAPEGGATMFVEVSYDYQPIVGTVFMPHRTIREIAAMTVRDNRDLSQIYNTANAAKADCNNFSAI